MKSNGITLTKSDVSFLARKKTKKILFCGYGASGKSTILRMVIKGQIPSKEDSFHATIDYERLQHRCDDTELTIFDLSGGTAFLDRFTGELSEFIFSGVTTLVYVVDSTKLKDHSRIKYYLDLCVEKTDQYSPGATVFIFQHKYDRVPKNLRLEVYQSMKEYLLKGITREIPYYETSVFDTSILIAMCAVYQAALGYIPDNWFEKRVFDTK